MKILNRVNSQPNRIFAVTERGEELKLSLISERAEALTKKIGRGKLVFLLCKNCKECLVDYLACLQAGVVPLLLEENIDEGLLSQLKQTYKPAAILSAEGITEGCSHSPALHPDLALLLTTSGSTGSPKLVRISGKNLDSNAASISQYLHITESDLAITMLPMSYSYGMSVINSHIYSGGKVLISDKTVLEKEFWELVKNNGVSSLVGVPYTYKMLIRAGLFERDLPNLKYLTQAGGKLPEELHLQIASWAEKAGKRFYVMYGQTEASPRMGYLPPEKSVSKNGSTGIAIPGGKFSLLDSNGNVITEPGRQGELIYQGENVSMGYALCAEDLAKGDEFGGVLHTGDVAYFDADGYYYICGRLKRFIKLCGNRINLDQVENILKKQFIGLDFACVGSDELLSIYYSGALDINPQSIEDYLSETLAFPSRFFRALKIDIIPRSASGKTLYSELKI